MNTVQKTGGVQYLTPEQLSARYNGLITVRTLANWRSGAGDGPEFVRVGGRIFYPVSKVEAWEAKHTFRSTAQYKAG